MKKRLMAVVAGLLAALLLAAASAQAAEGQALRLTNILEPSQTLYTTQDAGAAYAGAAESSGSAAAQAGATATSYWYYDTTYYRVVMPGDSRGPYASYLSSAYLIDDYFDAAYSSARGVLGADNSGYGLIYTWLYYDSSNSSLLGYYPYGGNSIYLNLAANQSYADFGATVAHETTHVLFDHKTKLYSREKVAESWVTESLAWYVGNTVYPYGDNLDFSFNSSMVKYYTRDGSQRASWYESGARYNSRGGYTGATGLDFAQLYTIGYFLDNYSSKGWGAIQDLVNYLAAGDSIDNAFDKAYGLPTGQTSIDSGPGVGTLYSKYLNYYLGHY